MKQLLLIGLCSLFFACNKNSEKPQRLLLTKLQAHHWYLDSLKLHQLNLDSIFTIVEPEPLPELYFLKDKFITLTSNNDPEERFYWMEEPNKIYFYTKDQNMNEARSLIVDTVGSNILVLIAPIENFVVEYEYYHAK